MWFELEEMVLRGWADVQSVNDCLPIQPGRGRVVLATVTHHNTFVMEVRLEGQGEPLRPTDRHRLFSITRNDWVPTASLQAGEFLRTAEGSAKIASIASFQGAHRVFNLEVETEHSYFAGEAKVLSHNMNPCSAPLDAAKNGVRWNNGWRTADGKFGSPNGVGQSGAAAEQSVWDAVGQKPGWKVIEGRVGVENTSGNIRYYDGAAVSPRGRVIGLEVKSGGATKTPAQREFDSGVSTRNPAIGIGKNKGLEVGRSLEIRR